MDKEEQMEVRNINIVVCPQCGKAVLMPFVKEVIACGCGYRKPKMSNKPSLNRIIGQINKEHGETVIAD